MVRIRKILLVVVSVLVGIFFILLDRGWYTEMGGLTSGEADTAGRRKNKRIHRGALGM